MGSNEQTVSVGGAELCVETFGRPDDPAVLLIAGAASSMDCWEDDLCQRLAAGGRYVVRYDHRDTGRSTSWPVGEPAYSGNDLVTDVVGVLDGLDLPRAHLVGVSMGGGIAQQLAVDNPDRVATLTLISTSPAWPVEGALSSPTERIRQFFDHPVPEPDWADRAAVIEYLVDGERPFAGTVGFDEQRVRTLARRVVGRTANIAASLTNHWVVIGSEESGTAQLGDIAAPSLVLHGTEDPLFGYDHAEALAAGIASAALVPLPGVGHQVPPPEVWDIVIPEILRHTSGGWGEHANRLAARALVAGNPTSWFEQLYSAATRGEVALPWNREGPHGLLQRWTSSANLNEVGRRAVVVGCGLGADAEYVADLGFDTVAFDVAESAIAVARRRHPSTVVDYHTADLLDLPAIWRESFDLVVEIFTVQALPHSIRGRAIESVAELVAPGGTLVLAAAARDDDDPLPTSPPWPLSRAEVDAFAADGLEPVSVEWVRDPTEPSPAHWLAEFTNHRMK